jgi:hypothetical protein
MYVCEYERVSVREKDTAASFHLGKFLTAFWELSHPGVPLLGSTPGIAL